MLIDMSHMTTYWLTIQYEIISITKLEVTWMYNKTMEYIRWRIDIEMGRTLKNVFNNKIVLSY